MDQRQQWEGKDTAEKEPGGLAWGVQEPRVEGGGQAAVSQAVLGHVCILA